MARPSDYPVWNSDETNNEEPDAGRQATGFTTGGDVPGSGELNWWMNLVYQWTVWTDEVTTGLLTDLITLAGGLVVTATAALDGVVATGGSSNRRGGYFTGGGTNGVGVGGVGKGTGAGGSFDGGDTTGAAVEARGGVGGSKGVYATTASGSATYAVHGLADGPAGSAGVRAQNAAAGVGLEALSSSGLAIQATPNATRASINIGTLGSAPTTSVIGDLYVTSAGVLKVCTVSGTPGTWATVGSQ